MSEDRPGVAEWVSFALICGCAALSAVLELMFLTEFYVGKVIVPIVVLGAIAGNLILPRWGLSVIHAAAGVVVPVALWLIVVLVPILYNRPEGDLFVLGIHGQNYAFYGLLLGGAIAGFSTIVVSTSRPMR